MSVKRQKVKRRSRSSSGMSIEKKKGANLGNVILAVSLSVIVLALSAVGIYAYQRITAVPEETAESSSDEGNGFVRPTGQQEAEKPEDPFLARVRKQEELKELVHKTDPGVQFAEFTCEPTYVFTGDEILDEAWRMALGYDYDGAIALIRSVTGYGNKKEYKDAIASFTARKAAVAPWNINNNITHIFFHSLIVDPAVAFDPAVAGFKLNDYNEAMTTVHEFVYTIESMYRKGYVLVDIYDVCRMETQPDGTSRMTYQKIMLPDTKKPFLLSIDDTNYYEYMTNQGFSSRLVIDENGEVSNEYILNDGTAVNGSFDVITILEDFIRLHPDFVYRNARGMAGITGYNGVLGYRTSDYWYTDDCPYYEHNEVNDLYKATEISGNNPNIEADKEIAKLVADGVKALGWRFASHTWGHKRLGQVSVETMEWDSEMWRREVEPILGPTDLLIFPYGNDFGQTVSWKPYEYEGPNERYRTMKSFGFNYFFNVDSSVYFMQRTDDYFREGRRNIDGDRIWEAVNAEAGMEGWKNRLTDIIDDPDALIDPLRPRLKART